MALITRNGFGQVEPNHLSAQRTGQIYAQLPANEEILALENGMFVKYDYANNEVNFDGDGEFMLVLNEVKLYDERHTYKDFRMVATDYADGKMYPRVFKTNVGDIYTTNMVDSKVDMVAGTTQLSPNEEGILTTAGSDAAMVWNVVKVYTMPDGQPAVKIQRIK